MTKQQLVSTDLAKHAKLRGLQWLLALALLGSVVLVFIIWIVEAPALAIVITTSPGYTDLRSSVSTIGRVVPAHEFQARAAFSGLIEHIDVQLGQHVIPGQMLIRLKDPYAATRVATAMSALQTAEVTNDNVQRGGSQEDRLAMQTDLDRAEQEQASAAASLATLKALQQGGAASGAEVHAAELRLQAAKETLRFANDRMSKRYSARDIASWSTRVGEAKSNLTSTKAALDNVNIRSPIAGTVYLIPVTGNDFVGTGAELLRVADLETLKVHANFDEADMGKLHEGASVEIRWEGRPDRVWHGVIEHVPMAAIVVGIRSVGECVISVSDAQNDLPPNTSVTVSVTIEQRPHVVTLPREALHTDAGATYVYRIEQGRLVQTAVETGLMNLDSFEVVKGISPVASVALRTIDDVPLFDGMKVRVRP